MQIKIRNFGPIKEFDERLRNRFGGDFWQE